MPETARQSDTRPDIVILMTDEERAIPPYESDELAAWRAEVLVGRQWFVEHATRFDRHYTGSLACVPSRPTIFTGQYPDLHGVTQTDGLGKDADDSRMRWLPAGEVPTLGHWFRAAGYDTHYDGKWHLSHADLHDADGSVLATNDDDGVIDPDAVQRYLDANPLDAYGFSGWVGPEPHGGLLANSGLRRDPLIAERVVSWLEDRYRRRAAGDSDAGKPFLLVASFVNPHDIVLLPAWSRNNPLCDDASPFDPPTVAPSPTDDEDLSTKPDAHAAYRDSYYSGYGPGDIVRATYADNAQFERDLYYRLHGECDGPLDRVRRAVTHGEAGVGGSREAVIVRTSDHGELLGSHGGLHQKWFQLYDEAARIPFEVALIRNGKVATPTHAGPISAPTSHLDIVPTLLDAAGADVPVISETLRSEFSEVHPLPGRSLLPIADGTAPPDEDRPIYLMTRDNIMYGDTGLSVFGRLFGAAEMTIAVPADVGNSFEALVAADGGHLWKLVRTFDDPAAWTEPGVRHLASSGPTGPTYRSQPLDDQWELYDLTDDPIEAVNLASDPSVADLRARLTDRMKHERARSIPERNNPWPYVARMLD